jgi:hypothetical protein
MHASATELRPAASPYLQRLASQHCPKEQAILLEGKSSLGKGTLRDTQHTEKTHGKQTDTQYSKAGKLGDHRLLRPV